MPSSDISVSLSLAPISCGSSPILSAMESLLERRSGRSGIASTKGKLLSVALPDKPSECRRRSRNCETLRLKDPLFCDILVVVLLGDNLDSLKPNVSSPSVEESRSS